MIEFQASYFDGVSAKVYSVDVSCDNKWLRIVDAENGLDLQFPEEDCSIQSPLGRTSHLIILPNGGRCESDDFAALEGLIRKKRTWGSSVVNTLEQHWGLALCCLAALVGSVWLFSLHGIPFLAEKVSARLPMEVNTVLTSQVLKVLDKGYFGPTELDEKEQARVNLLFDNLINHSSPEFDFRLEFRNSPNLGANAFALPSGVVVVTDQLVRLVEEDDELIAVLVHELAHVEERHGLRILLQNSGAFFLVSALVGDVASITSMAASLPTLMLETGYSRKFEQEADNAVGHYFISRGTSTAAFQNILQRMAEQHLDKYNPSLFATHPDTPERIRALKTFDALL